MDDKDVHDLMINKSHLDIAKPNEDESHDLEGLRKRALALNPKHGDKLYPLEVLGAYHIVNNSPLAWNFELGNPESFVDNQITKWMSSCDVIRFKNRLERCITQSHIIREIFLLRLNYALLMEEGKDEIVVHRGRTSKLEWYGAVDEEGNRVGNSDMSAVELIKNSEMLDQLADGFYSKRDLLESYRTGTPQSLRERIAVKLIQYGYEISQDLNEVYRNLKDANKNHLEDGLIARIAYLAFEAEENGLGGRIGFTG